MKLPGAPVIAQALPGFDDIGFIGRGQRGHIGKAGNETLEKRNHGGDCRLNEHHLRDEDAIRIAAGPPRQIPAGIAVPNEEPLAHRRNPVGIADWRRPRQNVRAWAGTRALCPVFSTFFDSMRRRTNSHPFITNNRPY